MIIDVDQVSDVELDADVAVVGAGPAGIVTALELADAGLSVLLIESGRARFDSRTQSLAKAEIANRLHADMTLTTRRVLGGASTIWGGRCVPFDPIDFEQRSFVDGRWPVEYGDLTGYFQRACDWFVCGRAAFDQRDMPHLSKALVPGLLDGEVRTSTFERWSLPTNFFTQYGDRLRQHDRLRVITGLTCTRVEVGAPGEVDHLVASSLDGRSFLVRAKRFVIASGGLETTRLLLASRGPDGRAIGDHSGQLGRFYMAHIEGSIATLVLHTPPDATIYGYEKDVDGVWVRRRISLTAEAQRRLRVPNIVGWIGNHELPDPTHRSGPLSLAYLLLASPLGRILSPPPQRLALTGKDIPGIPYRPTEPGRLRDHVRNIVQEFPATLKWAFEFGFGRFLRRGRRSPGFFIFNPDNRYPLQYHGEHLPHADSRVELSETADELGMPRLRIDLKFSDADVQGVIDAHRAWDEHLRATGTGHLEYYAGDLSEHINATIGGGFHQAGTTRMSEDPKDGVLTPELAVHGYQNLHVISSSAFVTSGQANSTFMIVVFALRLVDRIRSQLTA